jgi:hypothetical protein
MCPRPAPPPVRRLTIPEAVTYLHEKHGVRTTIKSLYKLRFQRRGPASVSVLNRVLYEPRDLDAWVFKLAAQSRESQKRSASARL